MAKELNYRNKKFGVTTRRDYGKSSFDYTIPYLLEWTRESYLDFMKRGLKEVFKEIFPIHSKTLIGETEQPKYTLEFTNLRLEDPELSIAEAKYKDKNYAWKMHGSVRLIDNESGEVKEVKKSKKAPKPEIFFGEMPAITPKSTFIINGTEKVIISNLTLGYGVIFSKDIEKGNFSYKSTIIPIRGKWINFDLKEKLEKKVDKSKNIEWKEKYWIVNASIDNSVSIPITSLMRNLGIVKNNEIMNIFEEKFTLSRTIYDEIKKTLKAIVSNIDDEACQKFIDTPSFMDAILFKVIKIHSLKKLFRSNKLFVKKVFDKMSSYKKNIKPDVEFSFEKEKKALAGCFLSDKMIKRLESFLTSIEFGRDEMNTLQMLESETFIHDHLDDDKRAEAKARDEEVNYKSDNITNQFDSWGIIVQNLIDAVVSQQENKRLRELSLSEFVLLSSASFNVEQLISSAKIETKTLKRFSTTQDIERIAKQFRDTFFEKNYDLTDSGRFKIQRKLRITERLYHRVLAQDLFYTSGKPLTYIDFDGVKQEIKKGTYITTSVFNAIKDGLKAGTIDIANEFKLLDGTKVKYEVLKVYASNEDQDDEKTVKIIGIDQGKQNNSLMVEDLLVTFNYLLCLKNSIGIEDDEYHLGNRKVRGIYELLFNQFRLGLTRMSKNIQEKMSVSEEKKITPKGIINVKPLIATVNEFFNTSQFVQFLDQVNPLSELSNKRRLTSIGSIGKEHKRSIEPHDVHDSHYGKICPIETPEGQNIGLIHNLSIFAKINDKGFITTPYYQVKDGKVTEAVTFLDAWQENDYIIAGANVEIDANKKIVPQKVVARYRGKFELRDKDEVKFMEVSPKQGISFASATIPFIEHDDGNRALMGANMQKQAIPLINPDAPIVGTGIEHIIAKDSGFSIVAHEEGEVVYVDASKVEIKSEGSKKETYDLIKFDRTNQETCMNHTPIVKIGQHVSKGQIIADGPAIHNGELALGQNVLVAFTTWNGYNYEDAIIVSDRIVKEDVYTSLHIQEYTVERRRTKIGEEEITRDVPNASEETKKYLDEKGMILVGAEVKEGDILVGKVTPKGQIELSAEDRLLKSIFGEKTKNIKDSSLRLPNGGKGIVVGVKTLKIETANTALESDVLEVIKIYVMQKRKLRVGDKMAGRHGNKGVVSLVLPIEDMPHLPDGTPVDIVLNPLGVPSRMNIGQILEIHLGLAAKHLGVKISTPVFEGVTKTDLIDIMKEAELPANGKFTLIDGRTGEQIGDKIAIGVMYMLKLSHMVDDKIHGRSIGPYSLITQQPLGGKSHNGGQRLGEMEVWALEAYGAAYTLREMLTLKSDDIKGRNKTYEAIIKGKEIPEPSIPASFRVLENELKGLGFYVELKDAEGQFKEIEKYEEK